MGLFQRFYYGKAGQADFNPEDLPKNRKELFMAMFRIRFSGLITQNLIYLVFCIPAIIICFQAFILLNSIAAAAVEDASLLEQFSRDWFSYAVMLLAILIPCMGLALSLIHISGRAQPIIPSISQSRQRRAAHEPHGAYAPIRQLRRATTRLRARQAYFKPSSCQKSGA